MTDVMQRYAAPVAWVLWLTVGFALLVVSPANAYIDPGSGSVIFQAVIAGAMAASLGIKVFWRRIKDFFVSLFGSGSEEPAAEDADELPQHR